MTSTYVLVESDFRSEDESVGGIAAWVELCRAFEVDPDTTDCVTVQYVSHDEL